MTKEQVLESLLLLNDGQSKFIEKASKDKKAELSVTKDPEEIQNIIQKYQLNFFIESAKLSDLVAVEKGFKDYDIERSITELNLIDDDNIKRLLFDNETMLQEFISADWINFT